MKEKSKAQKIALSGVLIGISVIFGTFSIPVGAAKISPIQHFVNVVGAVTLGPMYAVANAFITSLIRNIMGTGSLLAFPGSMVGAFLAGILYKKFRKPSIAVVGEIVGTGILGAVLAYPVAALILGKQVAVFVYVIPFISSCSVGAIIAYFFVNIPIIKKILINNEVTSDKKHSVDHI
ncbi:energy coupling factor transporter S component ThiW [Clostridium saccharoperbutylacetonicum]|uniref:Thiamine-precursor transport protein ThiW n=1 Tax=Clostridium saccharoperbutylacetonicum N1-4(HMT) TaxID=931276 RepID=M1MIB1_9CLOT|nr:energy coupling factor transporter S component ThiW [Clostridium saccharoperbutylacetonicum]AGF54616.1 thiamine-precursor transport protein ThiW [Clostridium saccharoperbutylacetonicum N1-4(HMT)]NRT58863.1 energy coupling factor transporter S component ThiW [Clostridium saccharoperbutylacetonicum]NSB28052.1 energy coupling factor transporter S component ThiW [Clostridium saccharoperbutylacetonicum]NSB41538.1 energy coupling factor transporter S component ThiW [Clostridium saccharoperbutylace